MRRAAIVCLTCLLAATPLFVTAQEEATPSPRAADSDWIVVGDSLDATARAQIRNAAISLHSGSEDQATLVLEIRPGQANEADVLELLRLLTSSELNEVRTVAWVADSLLGPRAAVALACDQIVLHPDAELGDLSANASWSAAQQQTLAQLVLRGGNSKVSSALTAALLDPATTLVRAEVVSGSETPEVRLATPDEVSLFREAGLEVRDLQTIKPAGARGVFTGAQAAAGGYLVHHTAREASEVAELYGFAAEELRARSLETPARPMLIQVKGQIDPLLASYLMRQIDRAIDDKADLVIFEIDSPGGLLEQSLELAFAIADLERHDIRSVAYVPEDAISGAAIIALGCDEIYLHPHGRIGDAGPIQMGPEGNVHRAPEKIVSYLRTVMKQLAERKDRPAALLMAMADRDLVVYRAVHRQSGRVWYLSEPELEASDEWERGRMVPESAKELLLTVDGGRAHELQLAAAPVDDFDELRTRLGLPEDVRVPRVDRTWLDDTVFILNTGFVTGFLFFLGILFLFIELHFTSGLFGILSALCFGLFFWSKFLGGTADWLEVLLFLLGVTCLLLEIFVIPGFGVFGVAGGLLVLGALVMANITFSDVDRGVTTAQTADAMKSLGIALVAVIAAGAMLSRFLPHIPVLNSMILTPPDLSAAPSQSSAGSRVDVSGLTGKQGTAVSMLRPSGKIRVEGQFLDAVSGGGFVAEGSAVEIVEVIGRRIVVRPLADDAADTAANSV